MPQLETDCRTQSLTIDNRVAEIGRMSEWLEAAFKQLELPPDLLFKFDLSANEAVTNVISYAFPAHERHRIELRLSLIDAIVSLEIEDDGMAFNPLAAPEHVQPATLEEAKIGGLGIDLVRKFMDECHYTRSQGKNILKLVAALPPSKTAPDQ